MGQWFVTGNESAIRELHSKGVRVMSLIPNDDLRLETVDNDQHEPRVVPADSGNSVSCDVGILSQEPPVDDRR
jgi:hypothetical protein